MKKCLDKSIIITGASVTGKTTLCRRLIVYFGLEPMPVHMTRELRYGEIKNVDGVFITEEEFKINFFKGYYLQDSLESTYFNGVYYGCPTEWIRSAIIGDNHCFVCPTVKMAKKIKELLGQNIFWVHLITNKEVRQDRLKRRSPSIEKENFNLRIERGNADIDITGHDLVIDTSYLNAWEIFFHTLAKL
jgi:guanylate kinase